jgi:hypothetical protein
MTQLSHAFPAIIFGLEVTPSDLNLTPQSSRISTAPPEGVFRFFFFCVEVQLPISASSHPVSQQASVSSTLGVVQVCMNLRAVAQQPEPLFLPSSKTAHAPYGITVVEVLLKLGDLVPIPQP